MSAGKDSLEALLYVRDQLEEAVKDLNWLDGYDDDMARAARSHIAAALAALDRIPLVIHHIDGDPRNNDLDNIEIR